MKHSNYSYHEDNGFVVVEHQGGAPNLLEDKEHVAKTLVAGHAVSRSETRVILMASSDGTDDPGNWGLRINIEEGSEIANCIPLGSGPKSAAIANAVAAVKRGMF